MTTAHDFESSLRASYRHTCEEAVYKLILGAMAEIRGYGFKFPLSESALWGDFERTIIPRIVFVSSCTGDWTRSPIFFDYGSQTICVDFELSDGLSSALDYIEGLNLENGEVFVKGLNQMKGLVASIEHYYSKLTDKKKQSLLRRCLGEYLVQIQLKKISVPNHTSSEYLFWKEFVYNGALEFFENPEPSDSISEEVWERDSRNPALGKEGGVLRFWYTHQVSQHIVGPVLKFGDRGLIYLLENTPKITDYDISVIPTYRTTALEHLEKMA